MAKSRAQRKAEQRRRRELGLDPIESDSQAQHDTQVPESGEVAEAEAAMAAGAAEADQVSSSDAPAPSRADVGRPEESAEDRITRRDRKRQEKEAADRAKAQSDRRTPVVRAEKEHGAVVTFFGSVRKELAKVQWPDRDTLVQASAVTLLFVAVAAAYLGILDAIFSRLVDLLIT